MKNKIVRLSVLSFVMLLFCNITIGAQDFGYVVVKGKVVDTTGEVLPGANIVLQGAKVSTNGTSTDENGQFTFRFMRTSKDKDVLMVSFLGMKTKNVKVPAGKTTCELTIELAPDNTMLDEVVIVEDGYNQLPRKDMVGSYTTVKAEDIMMPAYQTIDQMLQGKIAGMSVVNTSARVGAAPKITIRGTATILGNTDPLWVVDGVIQEDPLKIDVSSSLTTDMNELIGNQVSWLNPQDIETVTVLKDASATAIYGSKASNGVIVVTTKKGSAERTSVRYSTNFSIRQRPSYNLYDFMNSKERIQFSKEAYDAGVRYQSEPLPQPYTYEGLMAMYNSHMISEGDFQKQMQFLETGNTDWFELLTRNSLSQSHNLSVSGGSEKTTYNASIGYTDTKGMEIGNDQDQLTARLSINSKLNKKLTVALQLNGSIRNSDGYGAGVNPYSYALNTSRAVPAYDQNGDRVFYKQYYRYQLNSKLGDHNVYSYNIFNEMENSYSKNRASQFNMSLNINYKLFDFLTYQATGSLAHSVNDAEAYAGEKTSHIEMLYRGYPYGSEKSGSEKFNAALLPFGGQLTTNNSDGISLSMSHRLNFSKTFNEDHRLNAMLGMEVRSSENKSTGNSVWGYVPERGEILVSPALPEKVTPVGAETPIKWGALNQLFEGGWKHHSSKNNFMSFFATVAYSLKNRYVFNANIRSDASNRFGQDANKQFDPTWSVGFSWKLAEEKFMKDYLPWMNQMNLRGTYGIQGNVVQSISPDLIASYQGILQGYDEYYLRISSLPNPQLKWERTKTWNFGLDMAFLGITMNLEYYGRRSNAIIRQDIPYEYGMKSMPLNGGMISNEGIEATLNFTPYQTKDLAWTIGLNASKNWNKSKTDDRTAKADELTHSDFLAGNSQRPLKEGYPLSAFWSYSFAGLDKEGYPLFNYIEHDGQPEGNPNVDPTTFLVYSGQSEPYFTGGFNTRLRYKNFNIGVDFALQIGAKKRLPNPYGSFSNGKMPSPFANLSNELNDRWKKPGDEAHTDIPALYTSVDDKYNLYLPNGLLVDRYTMWSMSDNRVANASFLRCNQISASYHLPKAWLTKYRIADVALNANINNLFVIASGDWKGYDPELGNSIMPKMYSLGLTVSF